MNIDTKDIKVDAAEVLGPDVFFFDTPAHRMWYQVLVGGLHESIYGVARSNNVASNRLRREAYRWIMSTNTQVGSFIWITDHLCKDDPVVVREAIRKFAKKFISTTPDFQGTSREGHLLNLRIRDYN